MLLRHLELVTSCLFISNVFHCSLAGFTFTDSISSSVALRLFLLRNFCTASLSLSVRFLVSSVWDVQTDVHFSGDAKGVRVWFERNWRNLLFIRPIEPGVRQRSLSSKNRNTFNIWNHRRRNTSAQQLRKRNLIALIKLTFRLCFDFAS